MRSSFHLLFLALLVTSLPVHAFHRPMAGLGFTDNVNYEDTGEDSDFYLWLQNFSYFEKGEKQYSLYASYKNYFETSEYNALNFFGSVGMAPPKGLKFFDAWNLAAGGTKYTSSNPGVTEESFDNIYLESSLVREWIPRRKISLNIEPGLRSTYYTDFNGRWDQALFASGEVLGRLKNAKLFSSLLMEIVFSNNDLYRRNVVEFQFGGEYPIKTDLSLEASWTMTYVGYPGRRVNVETEVSRNRNRTVMVSQDEKETQRTNTLNLSVVKMMAESLQFRGRLNVSSQKSKSGYQDYTVMRAEVSVAKTF